MSPSAPNYMTPQAFTEQYRAQLRQALPNLVDLPIVQQRIAAAMQGGMSWGDGLAFAMEERHEIDQLRHGLPSRWSTAGSPISAKPTAAEPALYR